MKSQVNDDQTEDRELDAKIHSSQDSDSKEKEMVYQGCYSPELVASMRTIPAIILAFNTPDIYLYASIAQRFFYPPL